MAPSGPSLPLTQTYERIVMNIKTILVPLGVAAVMTAATITPTQAAHTYTAAESVTSASGLPASFKKKTKKPFYKECKSSRKFSENRFAYAPHAVLAGRCILSKIRLKGVQLVSSYSGHHPSATKALDLMVNLRGSCSAGNRTGDKVAKYLMSNSGRHGVRYLIWQNKYWASTDKPKKLKDWRSMNRGGCTAGHYDHVHVAFK